MANLFDRPQQHPADILQRVADLSAPHCGALVLCAVDGYCEAFGTNAATVSHHCKLKLEVRADAAGCPYVWCRFPANEMEKNRATLEKAGWRVATIKAEWR